MKQISISLLVLAVFLVQSQAQLTVADDNKVGIGVTAPLSKLAVGEAGDVLSSLYVEDDNTSNSARAAYFLKDASGGMFTFGMVAQNMLNSGSSRPIAGYFYTCNSTPLTSKRSYGIYSIAGNATSGYNYGVWARLAGSNNGAALFATTGTDYEINTGGVYAGYFRGDVLMEDDLEVKGTLSETSDINLKKDIRLLKDEETKQMDKLNSLDAIKYKLKSPADLDKIDPLVADTIKIDPRTLVYDEPKYTNDKIGLSAQDVQKVYPELVTVDNEGYLSLNYIGLIPVLIEALKEQNETMLLQADELALLREEIEKLKNQVTTEETTKQ